MAAHAQDMKNLHVITKLLALVVLGLLILSITFAGLQPIGTIELRIVAVMAIWLVGSTSILLNRRLLTWGVYASVFALMLFRFAVVEMVQTDEFFPAVSLLQFTGLLALFRLSDLTNRQSRVLGGIKEPNVAGFSKQPSYDLFVRSMRRSLSRLAIVLAGGYVISLIVLMGARSLAASFFAPYDVALYILALMTALVIMITYDPSSPEAKAGR